MNKVKSLGHTQLDTTAEAKGHVRAVVCTYGVIDKDNDVVQKGAIPDGSPVILSPYNHNSITGSAAPVGAGVIKSIGNEAILEAEFFMDTAAGREAFATVKALAARGLGEWSWGFIATDQEPGEFEGKSVNFIKSTHTFEASFVAVGAGVNTRTLEAKSGFEWKGDGPDLIEEKRSFSSDERTRLASEGKAMDDGSFPIVNVEDLKNAIQAVGRASDTAAAKRHIRKRARALGHEDLIPDSWGDGKKFSDEGSEVLTALKSYRSRAADVLAMRQEKGKSLGDEATALITDLVTEAKALEAMLADVPPATTDEDPAAPAVDAEGNEQIIASFEDDTELQAALDAYLLLEHDITEGETNA